MAYLIQPRLQNVAGNDKSKYVITFSYDFSTDAVETVNLGGLSFQGSQFTVNVSSLAQNVANLPAFRTLQFSTEFDFSSQNKADGELVILEQSTNQMQRFAGAINNPPVVAAGYIGILSACIPIVSNAPTRITFAKSVDPDTGAMFGKLFCTLLDFDVNSYTAFGIASS